MKQILTQEIKDFLIEQIKMIEEVALKDEDIQDRYFPHTIYEISSMLDKAVGLEIEYKDTEF
ncbi:MAG: hypothetical protein PF569_00290 [Candidatus Woesearchaeota archaeon]|jgi:hypothetical protein|nr:hypothetical protein [Candidatus Woesearchaeota archaeon]